MPDNNYPPYPSDTGAQTTPRQLIRWLDINPQGGALRRCQTFVTMPPFVTTQAWLGVSDIVAAFNFEGPNNVSLTMVQAPTNPNYALCVSYRIGTNLTRYLLWNATGGNIPPSIPLYTGQPILKNFRFEVWNTSQGVASDTNTYTFYTSKLSPIDYRFGSDSALVTTDGQVSNFADIAATAVNPPTSGLIARFRADQFVTFSSGSNVSSWASSFNNFDTISWDTVNSPTQNTYPSLNNQAVIDFTGGQLGANLSGIQYSLFGSQLSYPSEVIVVCAQKSHSGMTLLSLADSGNNPIRTIFDTAFPYKWNLNGFGNVTATEGPIILRLGRTFGTATGVNSSQDESSVFGDAGDNAIQLFTLAKSPWVVAEILVYTGFSTQQDYNNLLLYITQRYGSPEVYSLPLNFPSNAVSVTN